MKIEVWFTHEKGYYKGTEEHESARSADWHWTDDPFFIGANQADRSQDRPPVVLEELRNK